MIFCDREDVKDWLDELLFISPRSSGIIAVEKDIDSDKVKKLLYRQLRDVRVMQHAFWYVNPGVPFDEGRFEEMLCKLK